MYIIVHYFVLKVKEYFCVIIIMLLLIDSSLSEPPSSISLFRDITLFAKVFRKKTILVESAIENQDLYWNWLKKHGAFDFVDDIVPYESEIGFSIRLRENKIESNILVGKIGYHNFGTIISKIH